MSTVFGYIPHPFREPSPESISPANFPFKPVFRKSSAFEQLPTEIQILILEYCTISNKEIIPFPTEYQREEYTVLRGGKSEDNGFPRREREGIRSDIAERDDDGSILLGGRLNLGEGLLPLKDVRYREDFEGMALLGVNRYLHQQASTLLFGNNIWHLTRDITNHRARLISRHVEQLRHVKIVFSEHDLDSKDLSLISRKFIDSAMQRHPDAIARADGNAANVALKERIHTARLDRLALSCLRKFQLIVLAKQQVKGIDLDIGDLFCPSGCCRQEMFTVCVLDTIIVLSRGREVELAEVNASRQSVFGRSGLRVTGFLNEKERESARTPIWKSKDLENTRS